MFNFYLAPNWNLKFGRINFKIMKNLFIGLIATFSLTQGSFAQAELSKAIESGDVAALSSFMDDTVEICLLNIDDFLDKTEAEKAIKSFYSKYTPSSFKMIHQGISKGKSSQYYIGSLKTNEDSFRVFIAMENTEGKELIKQLRFEIE